MYSLRKDRVQGILVTGAGGPAGRGAIGYLSRRGFFVIGADTQKVKVEGVDIPVVVPPARIPGFCENMLDIVKRFSPSLMIPTLTEELFPIAWIKHAIEEYGCSVFVSHPDAIDITGDILRTVRFLSLHNIDVPKTVSGEVSKDIVLKELGLPVLSTPRRGRNRRDIRILKTREDLYREKRRDIVFQEFIPGDEYNVNIFVDRDDEITSCVVLKRGVQGQKVGAVERTERPDLSRLCMRIVRLLGCEGPVNIDIRLREGSIPVILEVNAKLGENISHAEEILDSLVSAWQKRMRARKNR